MPLALLLLLAFQDEPAFRTEVKLVHADVEVRHNERHVEGLTRDDFRVTENGRGVQVVGEIGVAPAGEFVVVWGETSNNGVMGRRFDADGSPLGPEFAVSEPPPVEAFQARVGMFSDGAFVVVSAGSEVQARAIADSIEEKLEEERGTRPWHVEGKSGGRWILLDYVDVVVHVFHERTREYYLLERLWGDAKRIEIADARPA